MSIFSRRQPKAAPRHTIAAVRAAHPAAEVPAPAGAGGCDEPHDATLPGTIQAPAADDTMVWRVPSPDGGPGFVIPPATLRTDPVDSLPSRTPGAVIPPAAVPALRTEPASPAMLRQVADALRALPDPRPSRPGAWLRAIEHDGQQATEALGGVPSFAGVDRLPDGTLVAGAFLGIHAGGTWLVDAVDPAWCEDAITALTAMRDHLVAAREPAEDGEAA